MPIWSDNLGFIGKNQSVLISNLFNQSTNPPIGLKDLRDAVILNYTRCKYTRILVTVIDYCTIAGCEIK